jgi:hypothetical protein
MLQTGKFRLQELSKLTCGSLAYPRLTPVIENVLSLKIQDRRPL